MHLTSGHSSNLIDMFVHWMVRALGWRAGMEIGHLLGPFLLVIALIAIAIYIVRRRRTD